MRGLLVGGSMEELLDETKLPVATDERRLEAARLECAAPAGSDPERAEELLRLLLSLQLVLSRVLVHHGELAGTAWVFGATGAGKTHLLQAASVQASETMRSAYFPLRDLRALGIEVLEGAGQLDCLCLDDLDVVTGARLDLAAWS